MLVRNSSKVHPAFDLEAARRVFAEAADGRRVSGEQITSPWDVHAVELLRDRHGLRVGKAVPTDVFVFGLGEPTNPACTKVGGRPFWPARKPWPKRADGQPMHFLAQFNFGDSRDIVRGVPADLLVLVTEGHENWHWDDDGIEFHWISTDEAPDPGLIVPGASGCQMPFYGAVYRTFDYPDAVEPTEKLDLSQGYQLPIVNGTKIGGVPHFIQEGTSYDLVGEFLCQLGSIQAAPQVPFPWVNQESPLGFMSREKPNIYEHSVLFGDMGSIYLFMDDAGELKKAADCY